MANDVPDIIATITRENVFLITFSVHSVPYPEPEYGKKAF